MWNKIQKRKCAGLINDMLEEMNGQATIDELCSHILIYHWNDLQRSDKAVINTPEGKIAAFVPIIKGAITAHCKERVNFMGDNVIIDASAQSVMLYTEHEYKKSHQLMPAQSGAGHMDAMTKSCIKEEYKKISEAFEDYYPPSMFGQNIINLRDSDRGYHIATLDKEGIKNYIIVKATTEEDWKTSFFLSDAEERVLNTNDPDVRVVIRRIYNWRDKGNYDKVEIDQDTFLQDYRFDHTTGIAQYCA